MVCSLCCCSINSCCCQGHSEGRRCPSTAQPNPASPRAVAGRGFGVLHRQLQRPRKSRNPLYCRDEGEVIALGPKKFNSLWKWCLMVLSLVNVLPTAVRIVLEWLGTGLPRTNITILILSFHCVLLSWVWVLQYPWAERASHKSGRCWAPSSLSEVCVCFSKAAEVWVQSPLQSRAHSGVFYVLCCSSIGCLI